MGPERAPDRTSASSVPSAGAERAVVATLLALIIAFPLLPRAGFYGCAAGTAVLTVVAFRKRWPQATRLGSFFCLVFGAMMTGAVSQIVLGAAIGVYLLIARFSPWLPGAAGWLRKGSIDRATVFLLIGFTALAAIALVLWHQMVRPDLRDLFDTFVPDVPLPVLLVGAILFAMVNAAVEEAAYRGVVQDALQAAFGSVVPALAGQAVAFGTLHIHGFPRGALGVGLASIYGLMMGIVRHRTQGMLAPWIAHVFTDIVIVMILLFLAR